MTTTVRICPACARKFAVRPTGASAYATLLCPSCDARVERADGTRPSPRLNSTPNAETTGTSQPHNLTSHQREARVALQRVQHEIERRMLGQGAVTAAQAHRLAQIGALHVSGIARRQVVLFSGPSGSGTTRTARAFIQVVTGAMPSGRSSVVEIHAPTMAERLLQTANAEECLQTIRPLTCKTVLVDEVSMSVPWATIAADEINEGMLRLLRALLLEPASHDLDADANGAEQTLFVVTTSTVLDEAARAREVIAALTKSGLPEVLAVALGEAVVTLGPQTRRVWGSSFGHIRRFGHS